MDQITIVGDGIARTKVLLPDGTNIANLASKIEIIVNPGEVVRAIITYDNVKFGMDVTQS